MTDGTFCSKCGIRLLASERFTRVCNYCKRKEEHAKMFGMREGTTLSES